MDLFFGCSVSLAHTRLRSPTCILHCGCLCYLVHGGFLYSTTKEAWELNILRACLYFLTDSFLQKLKTAPRSCCLGLAWILVSLRDGWGSHHWLWELLAFLGNISSDSNLFGTWAQLQRNEIHFCLTSKSLAKKLSLGLTCNLGFSEKRKIQVTAKFSNSVFLTGRLKREKREHLFWLERNLGLIWFLFSWRCWKWRVRGRWGFLF